jgi:cell division protein FtsZ
VASPLLEGVNLSGARGVLVNISASQSLKMREVKEVMNTVRSFAADDATIIFGAVFEEGMGDDLRVTVVATGLGAQLQVRQQKPQLVMRTGTDNQPVAAGGDDGDLSGVMHSRRRSRNAAVEALSASGMDKYDIPAFLRKQAD